MCLELWRPFGVVLLLVSCWTFWGVTALTSVTLQFSLILDPFATDYANQVVLPHLPIPYALSCLQASHEPGSSFRHACGPCHLESSHAGFETNPSPCHLSQIPAGIVTFMPPHCCGFLTPKNFSSVTSSLALHQFRDWFSSAFKF